MLTLHKNQPTNLLPFNRELIAVLHLACTTQAELSPKALHCYLTATNDTRNDKAYEIHLSANASLILDARSTTRVVSHPDSVWDGRQYKLVSIVRVARSNKNWFYLTAFTWRNTTKSKVWLKSVITIQLFDHANWCCWRDIGFIGSHQIYNLSRRSRIYATPCAKKTAVRLYFRTVFCRSREPLPTRYRSWPRSLPNAKPTPKTLSFKPAGFKPKLNKDVFTAINKAYSMLKIAVYK